MEKSTPRRTFTEICAELMKHEAIVKRIGHMEQEPDRAKFYYAPRDRQHAFAIYNDGELCIGIAYRFPQDMLAAISAACTEIAELAHAQRA